MSRYFMFRLALIPIGLIIAYGAVYMRRGHASDDERAVSHRLVASIDGYESGKDYYDQLVDDAHDQCFESCYHIESRGRDASWFDREQYRRELFKLMIQTATADKAVAVAQALTKYKLEHIDVSAPSARQKAADAAEAAASGAPPPERKVRR